MAIPFGSLIPQRSRVLPQGGAILGQLAGTFSAGLEQGRQRAAEDQAPQLLMDYLDAAGQQNPTLGSLVTPSAATGYVRQDAPAYNGTPTRENAATQEALTPGSPTFDGRYALRRENAAQQNPQPTPAPSGGGNYRDAISGIESGGDYSLVGPVANASGDRAYGRYQVMGANVGPWTQQVLGYAMTPQEFLANPQAQDAVFDAIFGGYVSQYGPEGAARTWFTGSPTGTGTDVLGTTADHYVDMFRGGGGGTGGGTQAPTQPAASSYGGWQPPSDQERMALRALIVNPATREFGLQQAMARLIPPTPTAPDYGFQEVGGVLYATDPRTRQAIPVAGTPTPQTPPAREIKADQNGVPRYTDTGEQVFPDVQANATAQPVRTLLSQEDGQLHDYMFDPATGGFTKDQGLADPGGQWGVTVGPDGTITMSQGRGTGNQTAAGQQALYLYGVTAPELPIIEETFSALTELGNQAAARGGDLTYWATSPEYQRAANSMRVLVTNYLYSVSGAAAPQAEVDNWFNALMPRIGESPAAVADKLNRVRNMVEQMRRKAAGEPMVGGGAASTPAAAPAVAAPAATAPTAGGVFDYDPVTRTFVPRAP